RRIECRVIDVPDQGRNLLSIRHGRLRPTGPDLNGLVLMNLASKNSVKTTGLARSMLRTLGTHVLSCEARIWFNAERIIFCKNADGRQIAARRKRPSRKKCATCAGARQCSGSVCKPRSVM